MVQEYWVNKENSRYVKRAGPCRLEAISLLDQPDVQDLRLTKGQAKLLFMTISGLKPKEHLSKADSSKPITTASLAKDQGMEEVLKKLEDGGRLDALMSCGGLDDIQ